MAELAGLGIGVVGLFPAAISAVNRCHEHRKAFVKHERLLKDIRRALDLQSAELKISLQGIGVKNFPTTTDELEAKLRERSPDHYHILLDDIRDMEALIAKMSNKMKIDINGKVAYPIFGCFISGIVQLPIDGRQSLMYENTS
jgi:hypothetical protein